MDLLLSYFGEIIKAFVQPLLQWFLPTISGVRFTFPVHGGTVPGSHFVSTWKYRWLFGMKLAVFHVKGNQFWPQGAPINDRTNKTLEKDVFIGDPTDRGEHYTVIIAAVSDDFRVAIRHYVQVNETLWNDYQIDSCIPLIIRPNDMPPGIIELDRVRVSVS